MNFKETKQKIKDELIHIAEQIRRGKAVRKPRIYAEAGQSDRSANYNLFMNRLEFRHMHIAYCEFFNRTERSNIEQPDKYNKPNSKLIDRYKEEWESMIEVVLDVEIEESEEENAETA